MIQIDKERCTRCLACLSVCPTDVYVLMDEGGDRGEREVAVQYPSQCHACGHCVSICPHGAISHGELPYGEFRKLDPIDITPEAMRNLILSRRSIRRYRPDPVPEEMVRRLVEVAIYAGSASNEQIEEFIAMRDQQSLRDLGKLVFDILWKSGLKHLGGDGLMVRLLTMRYGAEMVRNGRRYYALFKHRLERNKIESFVFRDAPLVIILHGLKRTSLGWTNAALAARNMELLALTMGLGTCWAGLLLLAGERSPQINRFLGLSDDRKIYGALMVGYPEVAFPHILPRRNRPIRWI